MTVMAQKSVSYGTVKLIDSGSGWGPRYYIEVNGQVKEHSDDYSTIKSIYDSKYY